jgi:diguanylate cyclase (GGDEF)-like protein
MLLAMAPLCAKAGVLVLEDHANGQRAEGYVSVLRDPSGQLDFAQVRNLAFAPLSGHASFGFTDDAIWLRLKVRSDAPATGDSLSAWWLEVALPSLDDVRFFAPTPAGEVIEIATGELRPFAERPLAHRLFLFPFELTGSGTRTLYLRVSTQDSLAVPIRLWRAEALAARMANENLWLGISYGIILAMLIYNGFLWLALQDRLYGFYLLASLTALLVILELNGHAYQFLWPDHLWLAANQHALVPALHFIALALWTRQFLDTRRNAPRFDLALRAVFVGSGAMLALLALDRYRLANQLAFWVGIGMTLLILAVSISVAWRGYRPARLFLLAQFAPLCGALVTLPRTLGWVADALWVEHAFQVGVSLEVLLFSLALARRIELLRREKQEALQRAETDPLTGLLNRAGLFRRVNTLLDCGQPGALLLVDLDHFKPVNDQLGHAAGDLVLTRVAERLGALVRADDDLVARIGGDEFVLVLRGVRDGAAAGVVADKLLASLTDPIATPWGEARIGASIGIALSGPIGPIGQDRTLDGLLRQADQAMYQAKKTGRNRWHGPQPSTEAPAT